MITAPSNSHLFFVIEGLPIFHPLSNSSAVR